MNKVFFITVIFLISFSIEGFSQGSPAIKYYLIVPELKDPVSISNQNSKIKTDSLGNKKLTFANDQNLLEFDSLLNQYFDSPTRMNLYSDNLILIKPGFGPSGNSDINSINGFWKYDRMPCFVPMDPRNMPVMKPDSSSSFQLLIKKP